MKYKMLILLILLCATFVAAIGGTLAGYTSEAAYSFSIQPDAHGKPRPQQNTVAAAAEPEKQAAGNGTQAETELSGVSGEAPVQSDTLSVVQQSE